MLAAVAALFLGVLVLWRRKGGATHKRNGKVWVGLMMITALSGFFIHEIRVWGDYSPIHIISALVPVSLMVAVLAARRGNFAKHRSIMKSTYLGGMIVAGGFTFLPGRLNHDIFFGEKNWSGFAGGHWILPITAAVLGLAYYLWRGTQAQRST